MIITRTCYIFAGGGTGGHICPALAVAEELAALDEQALIVFACSDRPIDRRYLDPLDYPIVPQPVQPLPKNAGEAWGFLRSWRRSRVLARRMIADLRPSAVLGLGGFAAAPVVHQAARRGIPTALLNPDAVVGRANRYLARRAEVIFTQFARTVDCLPAALRGRVRVVGCPVRKELHHADRGRAVEHFGLAAEKKTLLVFGGSMLAESITRAVLDLAGDLEQFAGQWQLLLIADSRWWGEASRAFEGSAIRAVVLEYCDRMDLAYAAADLTLCRGGAGTIAELAATRTAAVIMPYPHHKDRQQYLNAAELVREGSAVIIDDTTDPAKNADALRADLLEILRDEKLLRQMQSATRPTKKINAAADVAKWLYEHRQSI